MGAFILYPKNTAIRIDRAKKILFEKGLINCSEIDVGEYNILLFSKVLIPGQNFILYQEDFICCTGTFIYKGNPVKNGLAAFFNDFKDGSISNNEISGSFCIIIFKDSRLYLINDDENLYPVYFSKQLNCFSSSFLALCEMSEMLSINKLSSIENLITGCSFGFDTYFNEIKRFRWGKETILPDSFNTIQLSKYVEDEGELSKEQTFLDQKKAITFVFRNLASFADIYGCELGISGGYDSRLLLALCLKYFNNEKLIISSNYKSPPDQDLEIARSIAKNLRKKLNEIPVISTREMEPDYFENNLKNAFLFYDGQFRVNHGWTREYRTIEYRRKVLNGCKMGISGHAGELFRNDYNLDSGKFSYDIWIKNNVIGRSGRKKLHKDEFEDLKHYIKAKTEHVIDGNTQVINKALTHSYYNEVWVPSGPGIRNSIENQLSFYVSPFTDYNISKRAYRLIPYLGKKATYEKDLVNFFNENLSGIQYELKKRSSMLPVVYTTLMYRIGIDLHFIQKKYFKSQSIETLRSLNNYENSISVIKKILSNPVLNSILSVEHYINRSITESELERLIAFSYVVYYYYHKINA